MLYLPRPTYLLAPKYIVEKYKAGVQVHFKGENTIRSLLVATKDKDNIISKGEVIYKYMCDNPEHTEEYICGTGRTSLDRFKEHLKTPFPIYDHTSTMCCSIKLDNFSIVERESQSTTRIIKLAMFIRVNYPSLKRNLGKYNLPHIWDEVLQGYTGTPFTVIPHYTPLHLHGPLQHVGACTSYW